MLANYIKHFLTFAQVLAIIHKQMKNPVDSKKEHIGMVYKEKRQARDGIGSTLHDLADCETLRNSLFIPMT